MRKALFGNLKLSQHAITAYQLEVREKGTKVKQVIYKK